MPRRSNRNRSTPTTPARSKRAPPSSTPTPGGWATRQWDFLDYERHRDGEAADLARRDRRGRRLGEPRSGRATGREGVVVAVLDSGIAYRDFGSRVPAQPRLLARSSSSPATTSSTTTACPLDENGHGTHVAGTIAEQTNNGIGLTGLAYNAKLMPVRVLTANNVGYANRIAKGIHFAVEHHAQVINMSFNFGCGEKVPQVDEALREAYDHGIVTVASGGNYSLRLERRELRLRARHRAAGDRRRRHHRGRLHRQLLARGQGDRRGRARRRHPGRGMPVDPLAADLPGDA